jgi:hypothetical protein
VAAAGERDVLMIESLRSKQRMFGAPSFAVKLVRAGARELLVLTPR